jgi:hypothetical protein
MPDATVVLPPEPEAVPMPTPSALKGSQRIALSALAIAEASDGTAPATVAPSGPAAVATPEAAPEVMGRDTVIPAPAKHLGDVLGEAWGLCAGRRGLLAFGTLIVLLASAAAAGSVVGIAAMGPLWGGLVVVGLRAGAGRPVVLDDFFAGVRCFVPLAILGALSFLAVALGALLLVVPGLYLAVASMYAPFLVIDRGMAPWDAWRASRQAVHEALEGHAVLVVILSLANLGGLACLGVGLFITLPFTFVAVGVAYGRFLGYAGGVDRHTA